MWLGFGSCALCGRGCGGGRTTLSVVLTAFVSSDPVAAEAAVPSIGRSASLLHSRPFRRIPPLSPPYPALPLPMRSLARCLCCACSLLGLSGCLAPWNYRLPTVFTGPPDVERVEQQYHDPYPDMALGPDIHARPRQYLHQRPLPVRIREKADGSRIRSQNITPTPPPVSPAPGSEYPSVVPF